MPSHCQALWKPLWFTVFLVLTVGLNLAHRARRESIPSLSAPPSPGTLEPASPIPDPGGRLASADREAAGCVLCSRRLVPQLLLFGRMRESHAGSVEPGERRVVMGLKETCN